MSTQVLLIIGAAGVCGLIVLLLVRREPPIPDYADPDVQEVSLEEFLDESSVGARPGRHRAVDPEPTSRP